MSDVKVTITAYNQGLKDGLEKAKQDVKKFKDETESGLDGLAKKFAGIFAVSSIIAAGKTLMSFAVGIKDASDELNITTAQVQKLAYAFAQGTATQADFEKGMGRLIASISSARSGNAELVKTFSRLGVTWDQLHGLDPYEILMLIADGAHETTDKVQLLADATDVFGKTAKKLLPTLSEGSQAMRDFGDEAVVATDKAIKKAEEFDTKLQNLINKAKALAVNLVDALTDPSSQVEPDKGKSQGQIQGAPGSMYNSQFPGTRAALDAAKPEEEYKSGSIGRGSGKYFEWPMFDHPEFTADIKEDIQKRQEREQAEVDKSSKRIAEEELKSAKELDELVHKTILDQLEGQEKIKALEEDRVQVLEKLATARGKDSTELQKQLIGLDTQINKEKKEIEERAAAKRATEDAHQEQVNKAFSDAENAKRQDYIENGPMTRRERSAANSERRTKERRGREFDAHARESALNERRNRHNMDGDDRRGYDNLRNRPDNDANKSDADKPISEATAKRFTEAIEKISQWNLKST